MSKIALIFAGQGSQYVGMGKELCSNYALANEVFEKASDIFEKDIKKICFEGPKEDLDQTINTQQAVFVFNMATYELLKDIKVDFVAGHSLGEVCAAVASGSIDLEQGLRVVKKRAELIQEEASKVDGSMIAVLGISPKEIKDTINHIPNLYLSNFNSPMQTTISGKREDLEKAKALLKKKTKKVVDLAVSGAFHSPYMQDAADKFSKFLDEIEFKDSVVPLVANFDAKIKNSASQIKDALKKQIPASVEFVKMLNLMDENKTDTFIEIGPSKVISGLIKRTLREKEIYLTLSIDNIETTLNNFVN